MLLNVLIFTYMLQNVRRSYRKKMSINTRPEKLLTNGDLGQSPVKNNGPNKKRCYDCRIYEFIFINVYFVLYLVLNVNFYIFVVMNASKVVLRTTRNIVHIYLILYMVLKKNSSIRL